MRNRISLTDHDVVQLDLKGEYGTRRYGTGHVARVVHDMRRADLPDRCRLIGWINLGGRKVVVENYGNSWSVHRYEDPAALFG